MGVMKVTEDKETKSRRGVTTIASAVALLFLMACAGAAYWYFFVRGIVFSDDARFDGDLVDIACQISGKLAEVRVAESDRVQAGQVLFLLEKEALTAALDKAEAEVKSAEADLLMAKAQDEKALHGSRPEEIQMAEASERKFAAARKLAGDESERFESLYTANAITASKLDQVRTAYEEAQRAHEEALKRLELLQQGSRQEDVDVARANVAMREARLAVAEAGVRQALVNLDYAEVRAPCDGVVVRTWVGRGAMVPMGKAVLTLFNPATLHVSANIEEKDLEKIAIGSPVDVSVDAYPDMKLKGRVERITATANSEFSLIPAEGVSGTYIKVAQRVPIRIAVDVPADKLIGVGLSVEVAIHVKGKSGNGVG
ncbi:HlyD family secretion protein [Thermodesulfobacteriota bacterium]